ncbi:MAG: Fur family transcriptional regulator [Planctomycetota bacterium]
MDHSTIERRFEEFLRQEHLKMTPQRRRIFDKAFEVHEHFSVERMYEWLKAEEGPAVSRATVYRTLEVLERGGFIEAVETGRGEVVYEHVLGHEHHDHMVCRICGKIEEFQDEEIEALQRKNAERLGFVMTGHMLRLSGICQSCARELREDGRLDEVLEGLG